MVTGSQIRTLCGLAILSVALGAVPAAAQGSAPQQASAGRAVTFHKDIEPLLQRSCQRCHNPESVAPMSLLTYEQARPFARAMKQRTALKYAPWSRGVMPPWFLEEKIGIQQVKDKVGLSDKEIAMIGQWADAGAPRGNPADAPPPLKLLGAGEWALGKPDLIVETPLVYVSAVASDWSGDLGRTPIGLTEDRYASSAEFQETRRNKVAKADWSINNRFVFHHAVVSVVPPNSVEEEEEGAGGESNRGATRMPIHEVGRNPDVFPETAGRRMPAGGFVTWGDMHIHASGLPGSDTYAKLAMGFRLHPKGYKPARDLRGFQFGRTQIRVDPLTTNNREETYFVAPQAMKFWNYEPHMHANGVRMCLQAIYARVVETLNCAGYNHNWVRNYIYEENYQPLIPKGTVLHAIAWFDNSTTNDNLPDARNLSTFAHGSTSGNMFIVFNLAEFLTDEEYIEEVKKRKEFMKLSGEEMIGCPACYLPVPDPAPKPATPASTSPSPSATGGGTN